MVSKGKVIGVIVAGAIVGFLLQGTSPVGGMIWPPAEGGPSPEGAQLPLLIVVGIIEATAFGAGVAFLAFGREHLRNAPVSSGLATAAYLAIAWGLVSWVPHTSLHISIGPNFWALIGIEYAFHVTLVLSAAVLAWFFVEVVRAPATAKMVERKVAPTATK